MLRHADTRDRCRCWRDEAGMSWISPLRGVVRGHEPAREDDRLGRRLHRPEEVVGRTLLPATRSRIRVLDFELALAIDHADQVSHVPSLGMV